MILKTFLVKKGIACVLVLTVFFTLFFAASDFKLFADLGYTVNKNITKEYLKDLDAVNLLKTNTPVVYNSVGNQVSMPDGSNNSFSYLTDGLTFAGKHIDIWSNTVGLTIAFDMKVRTEFDKMWVLGYSVSSLPQLFIGEYNLYVSDSLETLFSDEKKIAEYKYQSGSPTQEAGQEFVFSAKPQGRYCGMKIINPTRDDSDKIIRLDELGVSGRSLEDKPFGVSAVTQGIGKEYLDNMTSPNCLQGLDPTVQGYNSSYTYTHDTEKDLKSWGDGNLFDGKHIDLNCSTSELRDAYIFYDLGCRVNIENLFVSNMYSSQNDYGLAEYAWYVSDTSEDLFNWRNEVYRYKNTDHWSDQSYDGAAQDVKVISGQLIGRYAGIRVIKPNNTDQTIRIESIGVFGKEHVDYQTITQGIDTAYIQSMGENLLAKRLPQAADADEKSLVPVGEGGLSSLTNGKVYGSKLSFSGKTAGMSLMVDSGKNMTVDKILVVSGQLENLNQAPAEYRVFISHKKDELFLNENRRVAYKAAAVPNASGGCAQVFILENSAKGRYVGIKIITPNNMGGSDTTVILDEIGVFGQYTELPKYYVETEDLTPEYIKEVDKGNLLKGLKPVVRRPDGTPITDLETSKWTDGIAFEPLTNQSHVDIYGKTEGLTITYALPERVSVSGIVIANHAADFGNYAIGVYELYISKYIDTLYNPQNMIAEFDNRGRWSPPYTASSQEFVFEEEPAGYFFGIRVLVPNETDEAVRLDEIVLLGEESPYVASPVNLLEDMPVKAYLTDKTANSTLLLHTDFTHKMQQEILDEDNKTEMSFKTNGKTLDFVIDLCRKMDLDSFHITVPSSQNSPIPQYTIYLSDYEEDIWEERTKFAVVTDTSEPIKKGGKGRFVRFSIPNPAGKQSIKILSLSAIGMDDQRLEKVNQLYNIKNENILFFRENTETYELEEDFDVTEVEALVDNNPASFMDYWGAEYGKESLNIVFNLGGMKSLDEITMLTPVNDPDNLVQPKKLHIYIEDTLNELFGKKAKPVAEYKFKSQDSGMISIRIPHKQGRYLRIAVVEGVEKIVSGNSMMVVFREIQAMGISIINVPDPNSGPGVAKTFTNVKEGVKVEILGLDDNDSVSYARTMKVERKAPTKAQIEQLMANWIIPYKWMYEISFYGNKGQKITDFGEREIRMTFKIPKPLLELTSYLACDSEDGMMVLGADYTENELVYTLNPENPNWNFAIATGIDEDVDWRVPDAPEVPGAPNKPGNHDSPTTGDIERKDIGIFLILSLLAVETCLIIKIRKRGMQL